MEPRSTRKKPPAAAVEAYRAAGERLVAAVDEALCARSDLARLIGGNPLAMMQANHRHHHQFMVNVFQLGGWNLLESTVPWVYRSYHAHGFDYGYFPVELAAWMAAIEAQLPEAAPELLPAYRWMLDSHDDSIARAEAAARDELAASAGRVAEVGRLFGNLLAGDGPAAMAAARNHLASPEAWAGFLLEVLQPAMYRVGLEWELDHITVAQEHLATATAGRVMAEGCAQLPAPPAEPGKTAVITAAPNEFHELGARLVSDLLELSGWRVSYLGANTPTAELIRWLREVRPVLLVLSVCIPFNLDRAAAVVAAIREDPELAGLKVMVGGQAFQASEELWQATGADGWTPDGRSAVEAAERWWRERPRT